VKRPRIMAVCGFGLGTSLVLKMTLDEVLAQHGVTAEVFCSDMDTALGQTYDLVVTSRELAQRFMDGPQPVIVVDNFLSTAEIEKNVLPAVLDLIAH